MSRPRLILAGAGHAHVQVIEDLADGGWPPADVTLISPERLAVYTGMVPGYLQGTYTLQDITIDLGKLCDAAGVQFKEASVDEVDLPNRSVTSGGNPISLDLLSIDIGSVASGLDLPGVREHTIPLRPLRNVQRLRQRVDSLVQRSKGARIDLAIVGAGAGGFEIAIAAHRRIINAGGRSTITIVDRADRILAEHPPEVSQIADRLLRERGVKVLLDAELISATAEGVTIADGREIRSDITILTTGAAPPPLLQTGLPLSADGYLAVDPHLRVAGDAPVWGAGDCIAFDGRRLPKAGVFAVRQGPVLTANLKAFIEGDRPHSYKPQADYLALMNTADGKALMSWKGRAWHGRPAWWLKDWIDRRWVSRFR